jgi:hypothetical protein
MISKLCYFAHSEILVLKVMSPYFQQNFSQFYFSVYSLILDPYVQRLLSAKELSLQEKYEGINRKIELSAR